MNFINTHYAMMALFWILEVKSIRDLVRHRNLKSYLTMRDVVFLLSRLQFRSPAGGDLQLCKYVCTKCHFKKLRNPREERMK